MISSGYVKFILNFIDHFCNPCYCISNREYLVGNAVYRYSNQQYERTRPLNIRKSKIKVKQNENHRNHNEQYHNNTINSTIRTLRNPIGFHIFGGCPDNIAHANSTITDNSITEDTIRGHNITRSIHCSVNFYLPKIQAEI